MVQTSDRYCMQNTFVVDSQKFPLLLTLLNTNKCALYKYIIKRFIFYFFNNIKKELTKETFVLRAKFYLKLLKKNIFYEKMFTKKIRVLIFILIVLIDIIILYKCIIIVKHVFVFLVYYS